MSASKWAYSPQKCDGKACGGDCDKCSRATMDSYEIVSMHLDGINDIVLNKLVDADARRVMAHEAAILGELAGVG